MQWKWQPPTNGALYNRGSKVIPLVGNFTDDNHDAAIDLCDTPDVLVQTIEQGVGVAESYMYLLSGADGSTHFRFDAELWAGGQGMTPAFADIDADGLPEVVAIDTERRLIAFEHDGTVKWRGDSGSWATHHPDDCAALAIYDLQGDGSAEIIAAYEVFDAHGKRLWGLPTPSPAQPAEQLYWCATPTAADLDGDGLLEVVFGNAAYRHDGSKLWQLDLGRGQPHIGNFDSDPAPEIILTNAAGISLVEADGTLVFGPIRPTSPAISPNSWGKPGVVHDFDGDGQSEFATGTREDFSVYEITNTATLIWTNPISDMTGLATATAFDFLGDGVPEAIYTDEQKAYAFDGKSGKTNIQFARPSSTIIEYPVVADIDNDGSAEILIVSNNGLSSGGQPWDQSDITLVALRDAQDRWVPARRVWNQHAYHVTNIREDGTLPKKQAPSHQLLNTFRANAQMEKGGACDPTIVK